MVRFRNVPWEPKPSQEKPSSFTGTGMGTSYGSGIKQPVGIQRSATVGYRPMTDSTLDKPPKSVV